MEAGSHGGRCRLELGRRADVRVFVDGQRLLDFSEEEGEWEMEEEGRIFLDYSKIDSRHRICNASGIPSVILYFRVLYIMGLSASWNMDDNRSTVSWLSLPALFQVMRMTVISFLPLTILVYMMFGPSGLIYQFMLPVIREQWLDNFPVCVPEPFNILAREEWKSTLLSLQVPLITFAGIFGTFFPMAHYLHEPLLERVFSMVSNRVANFFATAILSLSLFMPFVTASGMVVMYIMFGIQIEWQFFLLVFLASVLGFNGVIGVSTLFFTILFLSFSMLSYNKHVLKKWEGQPIEESLVQKHFCIIHQMHRSADRWLYPLTIFTILCMIASIYGTVVFQVTGEPSCLLFPAGFVAGAIFVLQLMGFNSTINKNIQIQAADIRGVISYKNDKAIVREWEHFLLYLGHLNPYWSFWTFISNAFVQSLVIGLFSLMLVILPLYARYMAPCITFLATEGSV